MAWERSPILVFSTLLLFLNISTALQIPHKSIERRQGGESSSVTHVGFTGIRIAPRTCSGLESIAVQNAIQYASYFANALSNAASNPAQLPFSYYFPPADLNTANTIGKLMADIIASTSSEDGGPPVVVTCQDWQGKCNSKYWPNVNFGYVVDMAVTSIVICRQGLDLSRPTTPCTQGVAGSISNAWNFLQLMVQVKAIYESALPNGMSIIEVPEIQSAQQCHNALINYGLDSAYAATCIANAAGFSWDGGLASAPMYQTKDGQQGPRCVETEWNSFTAVKFRTMSPRAIVDFMKVSQITKTVNQMEAAGQDQPTDGSFKRT
ncbi:MAG: hypothetical protein M1827_002398 [Pycnora praestabilis]|nr:MAG: hypothetical protein M1827_002398 [Pycnora praestabilis]